jgi:nucleotide-binding universal stress UspA family protein
MFEESPARANLSRSRKVKAIMLPIRKILAPTDFSKHAEGAVRAACELAEKLGAELHLLHVLADLVVPAGPDPMLVAGMPPEYYTEAEGRARKELEEVIGPDWPRPPQALAATRWGDAVEEVIAYAKEQEIGLIVLSTHGRTGLSHILLGSVAERIVRESPCPVLTIRTPA